VSGNNWWGDSVYFYENQRLEEVVGVSLWVIRQGKVGTMQFLSTHDVKRMYFKRPLMGFLASVADGKPNSYPRGFFGCFLADGKLPGKQQGYRSLTYMMGALRQRRSIKTARIRLAFETASQRASYCDGSADLLIRAWLMVARRKVNLAGSAAVVGDTGA